MSVPHESDYSFQGRSAELALLCDKEQPPYIINVHGESGIGKTSLLREAMKRLRVEPPAACVLVVDCEALRPASDRPQAFLQTLAEQSALTLDRSLDFTNMARGAVTQINLLAKQQPTYLFIDTTEAIQDDKHFWDQIELDLISPLVVTHKVSLVFAGRMPAPLTRFAVRRDLRLVSLTPLSIADDAPAQVAEILRLRRFKAASHKRAVAGSDWPRAGVFPGPSGVERPAGRVPGRARLAAGRAGRAAQGLVSGDCETFYRARIL
jgi:hypothetical protein